MCSSTDCPSVIARRRHIRRFAQELTLRLVLEHIRARNQVFSRCRMFEHLRSPDTSAEQRLSFAPCMAHFVFSFMDVMPRR